MATTGVVEKIVRIEVDYKNAIQRLGEYRNTLDAVKDAEKKLKDEKKAGKVTTEEYGKQMALLNQQYRNTSEQYRTLTKEVQNNIRVQKQHEGSLISLRSKLSNLTKDFDALSRAERNSATGRDLQVKINAITKEIKDAEQATQRFYRNVGNYRDALKGINELTAGFKSLGGIITGLLGGLGMEQFRQNMLNTARDFEDAIARVRAVANPLQGDFNALRDKAMELGRTTRYTASEVANGMEELARKGLKADDTLEAIFPTLQLAQANVVSIADAAQISASTMRAFGKEAKDLAHINDVLSAACANSAMNLNFVGEAMKTAGPVASVANVSLEETTALIGGLANVGMTGSDAGTGIKQIVLALTNAITTKKGKTILDKYNLDITEARIKTEGLIPILKEMKEAGLGESNAAMQKLVGKYAAPRLGSLVQNIDQVEELKKTLDLSLGENQRMFEQSLGNTSQAIYEMQSAWQGFMIDVYDSTDKFILSPINAITAAIRFLTEQIGFVTSLLASMFATTLVMPALKKFGTALSAPWNETRAAMQESRKSTIATLQNNANAAKAYAEGRKVAETNAIKAVEAEEIKLNHLRAQQSRVNSNMILVKREEVRAVREYEAELQKLQRLEAEQSIIAKKRAQLDAKAKSIPFKQYIQQVRILEQQSLAKTQQIEQQKTRVTQAETQKRLAIIRTAAAKATLGQQQVVLHQKIENQKTAITRAQAAKRAATEERIAAQSTAKIQANRLAAETGFWANAVAKAKMGWAAIATAGKVAGNAIKAVWSTVAPFLVMTAIFEVIQGISRYIDQIDAKEKSIREASERASAATHNQTIMALEKYQRKLDESMKSVSGYELELKKLREAEEASLKDKSLLDKQDKVQKQLDKSNAAVKEYERQLKNLAEREAAGTKSKSLEERQKNLQKELEKSRKAVDQYKQELKGLEEVENASVSDKSLLEKKRKAQEELNKAKEREAELVGDINGHMGTQVTDSNEMNRTLLTRIELLKKEAWIRAHMDTYTDAQQNLIKLGAKYNLSQDEMKDQTSIVNALKKRMDNIEANTLDKVVSFLPSAFAMGDAILTGKGVQGAQKIWDANARADARTRQKVEEFFGVENLTSAVKEAETYASLMDFSEKMLGEEEILKRLGGKLGTTTPSGEFQAEDPWSENSKKAKNELEAALQFLRNAIKKYNKELRGIEADTFFDEFAKAELQAHNNFQNVLDDIDTFATNAEGKFELIRKKLGKEGAALIEGLYQILADIQKESENKLIKQLNENDSKRLAKQLSLEKENYSARLRLLENYTDEYLEESKKLLRAQADIDNENLYQRYLKGEFGEVKEDKSQTYAEKRDLLESEYNAGNIDDSTYRRTLNEMNAVYVAESEWYERRKLLYLNYIQDEELAERKAKEIKLKREEQRMQNEISMLAMSYEAKLDLLYGYYDNMSEADKKYWAEQMERGQFNIDAYWAKLKEEGGFGADEYWNKLKERIGTHETEVLQLEYEAAVKELENIRELGRQKGETEEKYRERELAAIQKVQAVHTKANDSIEKSDQTRFQATQTVTNGLITLTEELGKEDKEAAKLAKVLALFNIMVNTAEAIAKMTSKESGKGIIGIATTAAGIASIMANMASAMSILKQAKFAKGAVNIGGAGSETSDSIPARISRGESVINAKATKMFEPILIAMNNIGNGVALPRNNYVQTQQTADMTEAFTTAASKIKPVVDVREVTRAQNRVTTLENLDSIS